jgi:hypothetical protein
MSELEHLGSDVLKLAVFLGFAAILFLGFVRGDHILNTWAAENGYRIIKREYKFFWNVLEFPATRGQSVYRVTVVDASGNEKSGLVRCGDWLLGILVNTAFVKWDE